MNRKSGKIISTLLSLLLMVMMMGPMPALSEEQGIYIRAFASLDAAVANQSYWFGDENRPATQAALNLPATLAITGVHTPSEGTPADSAFDVPVSWTADKEYAGELGEYVFTPSWDESAYELADGMAAPTITVAVTRLPEGEMGTRAAIISANFTPSELDGLDLGSALEGYNPDDHALTITISNPMAITLNVYVISRIPEFSIDNAPTIECDVEIAPYNTRTITVRPAADLAANEYSKSLRFIAHEVNKDEPNLEVDYPLSFTVEALPADVTDITGIPSTMPNGGNLTLSGVVQPSNATNQEITWSIKDAGHTGASIDQATNVLSVSEEGAVIITATITDGLSTGDYTKDFLIEVVSTEGDDFTCDTADRTTFDFGFFKASGYDNTSVTKSVTVYNNTNEAANLLVYMPSDNYELLGTTDSPYYYTKTIPAGGSHTALLRLKPGLGAGTYEIDANAALMHIDFQEGVNTLARWDFGAKATVTADPYITVSSVGLNNLKVGEELFGAEMLFTLHNGTYVDSFSAALFPISNLPNWMSKSQITRVSDTVVSVSFIGTPSGSITTPRTLNAPETFVQDIVAGATKAVPVADRYAVAITVAKGDGAAVVGTPVVSGTPTSSSITVTGVTSGSIYQELEYAISENQTTPTTKWQTDTTFTELQENTEYYVFARTKETPNRNAGTPVMSAAIKTAETSTTTPKITASVEGLSGLKVGVPVTNAGVIYMLADGIYASSINADDFTISNLPDGLTAAPPVRNGNMIVSMSITGTPTTHDPNTTALTIPSVAKENVVGATSAVAVSGTLSAGPVAKGDGAAVSGAPTANNVTSNSLTVNAVTNIGTTGQTVEYVIRTSYNPGSVPSTGWQDSTTFTNLTPGTTYYVQARTKENDNYEAGAAKVSAMIKTDESAFVPVTNIIDIPLDVFVGVDTVLNGRVIPVNASSQYIHWSIKNAGTTGATLLGIGPKGVTPKADEDIILVTTGTGTLILNATVYDGIAIGENYSKDFTITVKAAPVKYTIDVSASPSGGGTVSGGGSIDEGTNHTVSAKANSGYSFVKWTEDGAEVSGAAKYSFTVNGDRELVAHFEKVEDDEDDSIPQTSDDSANPGLWLFALIPALLMAAVALKQIINRRRIIGGR